MNNQRWYNYFIVVPSYNLTSLTLFNCHSCVSQGVSSQSYLGPTIASFNFFRLTDLSSSTASETVSSIPSREPALSHRVFLRTSTHRRTNQDAQPPDSESHKWTNLRSSFTASSTTDSDRQQVLLYEDCCQTSPVPETDPRPKEPEVPQEDL